MYNSRHDFQIPPLHFLEHSMACLLSGYWLASPPERKTSFLNSLYFRSPADSLTFFSVRTFLLSLPLLFVPFMARGVSLIPNLFVCLFIVCFCHQFVSPRRACLAVHCWFQGWVRSWRQSMCSINVSKINCSQHAPNIFGRKFQRSHGVGIIKGLCKELNSIFKVSPEMNPRRKSHISWFVVFPENVLMRLLSWHPKAMGMLPLSEFVFSQSYFQHVYHDTSSRNTRRVRFPLSWDYINGFEGPSWQCCHLGHFTTSQREKKWTWNLFSY